jgi:magnesium-transporting ATPase (P-type)
MKTDKLLKLMKTFSWIIFIGLCIKAGALLISFLVTLFINENAAKDLYVDLNLFGLYQFSQTHFVVLILIMLFVIILKAYLFYVVISIFSKVNLKQPFNLAINQLISKMSAIALGIGLISVIGDIYTNYLVGKNYDANLMWSSKEFLFIACILFVISLIYKQGIELQTENELTI